MSRSVAPGRFFSWSEFERSTAAAKAGIVLRVPDEHMPAVRQLCAAVLDPLRERIGKPVRITGGYRTAESNRLIGGSKTSQHMVGEAVDIKVSGVLAVDLARAICDFATDFDQVIWYAPTRGGHVHVSYTTARPNRRQTLHAPAGGGYSPWRP